MAFQHLISELTETPSISDEVRVLYDKIVKIPSIKTLEDLDNLIALLPEVDNCKIISGLTKVNISIMAVHATVLKPYVDSSTIEDDFI